MTEERVRLIGMLADGRWHSGEALAQKLGITRAAVWKRLQGLKDWGLDLQSVHGRGYRFARPIELLERENMLGLMSDNTRRQIEAVDVFPVIDSTNTWLMQQPAAGAQLCLAEYQAAGRGRRGRNWVSPFAANLYLSLSWRFAEPPARISALTLAVGVGLAEMMRDLGAEDVGLKWPNDLLWRDRKLAGVLVEHRGETGGPARVVVGVGLNLRMSAAQAADISQSWTTLDEVLGASGRALPPRNELAAVVTDTLVRVLQEFARGGFGGFQSRWAGFDAVSGRGVMLEQDGRQWEGRACGIDGDGSLLIEASGQRERFLSGELSLRLAAGVKKP